MPLNGFIESTSWLIPTVNVSSVGSAATGEGDGEVEALAAAIGTSATPATRRAATAVVRRPEGRVLRRIVGSRGGPLGSPA